MITVAKSAGYCFGVRRAVEITMESCKSRPRIYTLGPVIHNKSVVAELEKRGALTVHTVEEIPDGAPVVIRAHGIGHPVRRKLEEKNCEIIDATCPYVERIHEIVRKEELEGRQVVILGTREHPEVMGIAGSCEHPVVIESVEEAEKLSGYSQNWKERPISVVAQTTSSRDFFLNCQDFMKKSCTEARFFDTICKATSIRQEEARALSDKSDCMVVIGDKSSANTKRLADICRERCSRFFWIENAGEFSSKMITGSRRIGITAGASTPEWVIKEVVTKMSESVKVTTETGESFEELLDQSFKTLYTGEKVTGVITAISGNEIYVDLGVKQAGFIPVSELSDDPSYKIEDHLKIGDEIETFVMRVNDVEGVIMLSKKRLDTVKGWENIEAAVEDKTVMEGIVVEENKGGLVVNVSGVRVFVPASQSGLPKGQPLSQLIKTKVRLMITEVNRQRRRVVGSIRAVQAKERQAAAEKVWETIEPGVQYDGVVKSLTSYGAFVDIGGVDGMVHVSELSWNRIRHPSEVLEVGQAVKVYVISVDKEKKKISLGYKDPNGNPWTVFENNYKVGMVVPVKVVKFMPFGAFAEIVPGVDGLIHISQIADHRIGKPDDVLTIGEIVEAKIIDVDWEKKKISLSIRAILEGSEEDVSEEVDEDASEKTEEAPEVAEEAPEVTE